VERQGFNWHKTRDDFRSWIVPVLLSGADEDTYEEITEVTNGFTNVVLTMQVNGVEVPVEHLEESLWRNVEKGVQEKAWEICREVAQVDNLQKLLDLAKEAIERELYMHLTQGAGIKVPEEDDE
jgi:hypothetical protein